MSLVFDNDFLKLSRRQLPQCASRLDWQKQQLNHYRLKRLRSILAYAKQNSLWYKDKLSALDIDNFTIDQMYQLPILTKADLMANWDDVVTERSLTLSKVRELLQNGESTKLNGGKYQVVCSGGTSGQPGIFIYDKDAWINSFNSTVRVFNRDIRLQGALQKKLCKVTIAAPFSSHMTSNLTQHQGSNIHDVYLPVTLPYAEILNKLNRFSPDILQGYPSILLKLAESQRDKKINLRPSIVVTMGEPLFKETAAILNATWHTKVYNVWACGEFGPLAITCNQCDNLVSNMDHCLIERADDMPDTVLVTGLHNKLMPLIRYRLEDEVISAKPNACCKELEVFGGVMGRAADTFVYGDILIHSYCFRSLIFYPEISNYQVVQTPKGICLRLEKPLETHHNLIVELQKAILIRLKELGVENPDVQIIFVSEFHKTPAGKVPRFIALR